MAEYFWRHEPVRPSLSGHHKGIFLVLHGIWTDLGEAKVCHLENTRVINEEIGWFEVAVNDRRFTSVEINHALRKLSCVNNLILIVHLGPTNNVRFEDVQQGTLH